MAKVEMYGGDHGNQQIVDNSEEFNEYADKVWQESQLAVLIAELTKTRKTVQSKIDAMRKRLKRLTDRLNGIEEGWRDQPA